MAVDYFPTPTPIAEAACSLLRWQVNFVETIWDVGSGPRAVWGLQAKKHLGMPGASLVCVDPFMGGLISSAWGKVDEVIRKDYLRLFPSEEDKPDLVVCNPPYSKKQDMAFMLHTLEHVTKRYALFFLSLRRLEGKERYPFWNAHPPAMVMVYAGRLVYGNGSDWAGRMAVFFDLDIPVSRVKTRLEWVNLPDEAYDARKEQ